MYGQFINENDDIKDIHPFFTNFNRYYAFRNHRYYNDYIIKDIDNGDIDSY